MVFLIIEALDESTAKTLKTWANGIKREDIQKYFIRNMGNSTYLTEANGEVLALALALKERSNGKVEIFIAKPLSELDIPDEIKEVVRCLVERPTVRKELEKVKNLRARCYTEWKKK